MLRGVECRRLETECHPAGLGPRQPGQASGLLQEQEGRQGTADILRTFQQLLATSVK